MRITTIVAVTSLLLASGAANSVAVDLVAESGNYVVGDSYKDLAVRIVNSTGSAVNLAAFSVKLEIDPVLPRYVEFDATTQPDTLTDPAYVFSGNSAALTDATTPWTVTATGGIDNLYTFADTTSDGNDMTLAAGASKILANFRILQGTATPGDIFSIRIVALGTELTDANFGTISFTPFDGSLTVVPEPSTLILSGLSALALGLASRRRFRQAKPSSV